MTEARLDPRQRDQFVRERRACVVGRKTFERFGWKLGDRITLLGAMWPCDPELVICGVYTGFDETNLYFHHEYVDELLATRASPACSGCAPTGRKPCRNWPSALTPNSRTPTRNEDRDGAEFQLGFVSMLGNVKALIGSISSVVVFTLLLVTAAR